MEAASIPWRPLGRLLVEQGLLSAAELELALADQEKTGRRLGETLVECGFVSGPELSHALAAQYGIELMAETGFGTGLRTEIQRRHETERRSLRPVLSAVDPVEPAAEDDAEPTAAVELEESAQAVQAQLEEQWAKLAAAEERLAQSHRELTALAHEYDQRRGQARRLAQRARHAREQLGSWDERGDRFAQLESEARGREAEIDRLRSECLSLRAELAGAEAASEGRLGESLRELVALAREYDRRRGQAARLAQRARVARAELDSRHDHDEQFEQLERDLCDRETEIGRLRDGIAGAEAVLAERDRLLEGLRQETERRRGQAVRFLGRARAATASEEQLRSRLRAVEDQLAESRRELASRHEHDGRIAQLESDVRSSDTEIDRLRGECAGQRDELAGATETVAERDRLIEELRRAADRRHAQAVRLLKRARGAKATEEQLADTLTAAEEQLAASRRELASQRERRRSQLTRFIARVRERDARVERLAADVRGCDSELDRLRHELETRLDEQAEPAAPPPPASHLVFVHLPGGYELVEHAGPPPARNTVLELPELVGRPLIVAGLSRSPLPGDPRPCAFVIQAR